MISNLKWITNLFDICLLFYIVYPNFANITLNYYLTTKNMKKFILTLLLAMGVLVSSAKAPLPFSVQAPSWTKMVVPSQKSKTKVTVYKLPSVSSAKLYYMPLESDIGDDYQWLTVAKRGWYVYNFQESRPVPVLEEKAGFYKVYAGYSEGWIKSTACNVVSFKPIKPNMLDSWDYKLFTTGAFAGYCVVWNSNEMEGIFEFEIGKMVGNFIVLKYSASYYEAQQNTKVSFKNTDVLDFSLESLKDSDFVQLMEVATPYDGTIGVIYAVDNTVEVLYNVPAPK